MIGSQLSRDLAALRSRRAALRALRLAGSGALLLGIGGKAGGRPSNCLVSPAETPGPFPADGTGAGRGRNVLELEGIKRSDVRASFAGMTGRAEGVPLDLEMTVIGAAGVCLPLPGWGVYLWHNDAAGDYSLYDVPSANYLRGLQQTGEDGVVRFRTIVPGCYRGRSPHIHFEIFSSAEAAVAGEPGRWVSQLALPEAECRAAYAADPRYGDSLANLERWPRERDFVFRDSSPEEWALQTVTFDGDPATGFRGTARLSVRE